jgi:hypothetical protein
MRHFYFIENNTGEEFIVGASNLSAAKTEAAIIATEIAATYDFEEADLSYQYEMTDDEAESSGLDEF